MLTLFRLAAIAGTSLGLDVLIIILPIPILWKLNLSLRQRVALVGVFSMGLFVTVIQIIRIFTIANLASYTDSEAIVSWSVVELNLGIVVASAPTFAPLLRWASERLGSSRTKKRGYGYPEAGVYGGHSGAAGLRSNDLGSKSIPSSSVQPGFNFALTDMRKNGQGPTKSKVDTDAESQEEILKLEDGIRITTSIHQAESERTRGSMQAPDDDVDGRTSRSANKMPGW